MKKTGIFILLALATVLFASCLMERETKIKSVTKDPNRIVLTYVLDTLDNGHILMYEENNHDACCIEYPECPKCKENLKKTIIEAIDSIVKINDDAIINELSNNRVQTIHIYDE